MQNLLQQIAAARSAIGLSARRLCAQAGLNRATLSRWQQRERTGQPLLRAPGPAKTAPLPLAQLREHIAQLSHGAQHTLGTGPLYRQYQPCVSRRQLGAMVRECRQQQRAEQRDQLQHITWFCVQTAWALDATEWRTDQPGVKLQALLTRDLASNYNLGLQVDRHLTGDQVAEYLEGLIVRYGPPLFLKRDNGAVLHTAAVEEVLARAGILPLTSPVEYPRYNGGIEKHIGDFKALYGYALPGGPGGDWRPARALLEALRHEANACPRRGLFDCSPAEMFYRGPRLQVRRRERQGIFDCLWEWTCDIISAMKTVNQRLEARAWRLAAESWLRCQALISVTTNHNPTEKNSNPTDKNHRVLPLFLADWPH